MKLRNGFVTNSSTTNFIIVNITDKQLSLKDFFEENPELMTGLREAIHNGSFDIIDCDAEILEDLSMETIGGFRVELYGLSERSNNIEEYLFYCVGNDVNGKSKSFIWRKWRD